MAHDIISNDTILAMADIDTNENGSLSRLPLGLLLGRVSGALRVQLLDACPQGGGDVRLIGLALAIKHRPGATQADYARFLGIDLNTASRLINKGEASGLWRRVASPVDRRAFALDLADAGKALAAEGMRAVDMIETRLVDAIGAEELALFRHTAERILLSLSSDVAVGDHD